MSENPADSKTGVWPNSNAIFIETVVIILIAMFSLFLQHGSIDYTVLVSNHALIVGIGSLGVWFVNRFTLERILQSRIESGKITRYLPFELLVASILATTTVYIPLYLIFVYLEGATFVFVSFLQGLLMTMGLSLLIVMLYVGSQVWKSWWSDGKSFFQMNGSGRVESEPNDFISIKNSRETIKVDLNEVRYFISESKIVFLVDTYGKKRITQYNLSELEEVLGGRFFRLNRKILVSRQVISQIKRLPNHRLLVTIGESNENHIETISRYKSTRFKHWLESA